MLLSLRILFVGVYELVCLILKLDSFLWFLDMQWWVIV